MIRIRAISEKRVRRELERNQGRYKADLGFLQSAWNPECSIKLGFGSSPFIGPGEVSYERREKGDVEAHFDPQIENLGRKRRSRSSRSP